MTTTTREVTRTDEQPDTGHPDLDLSSQIAAAMIHLVRLHAGIRARVAGPEGDLSPLFLLVRISHQGPSRAGELAEQLCADPSTVSRQVASLVKSGLLERRADPADGRASILVLTDAGRRRVAEHTRRRGAAMWPVLREWPEPDREHLLRLVRRYAEGVERHRDQIIATLTEGA